MMKKLIIPTHTYDPDYGFLTGIQTGAVAGSLVGTAAGIGACSLYPASLNYINKHSGFYPSVLTVDQIITLFYKNFLK
jgi:hypothetical protein